MARPAIASRRAIPFHFSEQPEDEGEMSESCLCALADGVYCSIGHPIQTALPPRSLFVHPNLLSIGP